MPKITDEQQALLEDLPLTKVAAESGVHYQTVWGFADGQSCRPETVEKICSAAERLQERIGQPEPAELARQALNKDMRERVRALAGSGVQKQHIFKVAGISDSLFYRWLKGTQSLSLESEQKMLSALESLEAPLGRIVDHLAEAVLTESLEELSADLEPGKGVAEVAADFRETLLCAFDGAGDQVGESGATESDPEPEPQTVAAPPIPATEPCRLDPSGRQGGIALTAELDPEVEAWINRLERSEADLEKRLRDLDHKWRKDYNRLDDQRIRLQDYVAKLEAERDELRGQVANLRSERDEFARGFEEARGEADKWKREHDACLEHCESLLGQREDLRREVEVLQASLNEVWAQFEALREGRDPLADRVVEQYDPLENTLSFLRKMSLEDRRNLLTLSVRLDEVHELRSKLECPW